MMPADGGQVAIQRAIVWQVEVSVTAAGTQILHEAAAATTVG